MPTIEPKTTYGKPRYKTQRSPYEPRPQFRATHQTRGFREAHNLHHHPASLRGPLLNHRKSKKNPHLTDMAVYYKKGGRTRRHTRRR
jgi:hypothetical protein